MPLLDHFHPPLSERRPWESFHTTWAGSIADLLNRELLPPGYIALELVHGGAAVEVGAFRDDAAVRMPDDSLDAIGYRPLREGGIDRIDGWPVPLELGRPLPTMPLSLHAECCLPLELEAAYTEACQRRRVDEVLE